MPWNPDNPEPFFRKHAPDLVHRLSRNAMKAGVHAANGTLKRTHDEGRAIAAGISKAKEVQASIKRKKK